MKNAILLIVGVFLTHTVYSQNINKVNWNEDLDFIAKELPRKHCNFFAIISSGYFLEELGKIKLESKKLTNLEVALRLRQLIASAGDSHTVLDFSPFINKNQILPLQLYWFSDGVFIIGTTSENNEILGQQLVSINGFSIDTISNKLISLITVDNSATVKKIVPQILPSIQLLEYFGFINEKKLELGLVDSDGNNRIYKMSVAEIKQLDGQSYNQVNSTALCYKNKDALFVDSYLPESKIYCLQYNKCWSKETAIEAKRRNNKAAHWGGAESEDIAILPSFSEFEKRIFKTLEEKSVNKIIFDMRFNPGGSSLQGQLFISKLAKYLKKNPHIKIYVVIGRATYSSAVLHVIDFKTQTNAILVGEETSGKPNSFGEVMKVDLPSSGLKVFYSTKYIKYYNKNVDTVSPDVKIELSFSDFKKGVDPVYEWIKKQ
ncbi:MAG: hypothetical protein LBV12_06190 [Puniceicoccales bacterium]|jgi:outer membrane protein OmpA-like peptidoglycan-associated protein|nr:hypothetical protein [Puniceicoccales bacterium]